MIGPIEHGYETYDPLPPATMSSIHTAMNLSSQSFSDMTPLPPRLCLVKTKDAGFCRGENAHEQLQDRSAILDLGLKWVFPTFRLTFKPLLFALFLTFHSLHWRQSFGRRGCHGSLHQSWSHQRERLRS